MIEVSAGVYRATEVSQGDIAFIKDCARRADLQRARICLHEADDSPVQEMIVAMTDHCAAPVHRHDEYETLTVMEGLVMVHLYKDAVTEESNVTLSPGDKFILRVGGRFHKVRSVGPIAVIHEVKHGPFRPMVLV